MNAQTKQPFEFDGSGPESKKLLMRLEPSELPMSGLSKTSDCVNRWCQLMIRFLQDRYEQGRKLTFHLWPFRSPAGEIISIQNLFIVIDDQIPSHTTHLIFTVAHTFSGELYVEHERQNQVQCLVPDYAEALHITGILANQLDASVKLFGQDTDQNPMASDEVLS